MYDIKYVNLVQTHNDGTFHFHLLLYWNKNYPKDSFEVIEKMWQHGHAFHRPIRHNEDILFIAVYFVDGLTTAQGNKKKTDIAKSKKEKGAIKQARLEDIPAYSRIISHSKGMEKAKKESMTYAEAIDKVDSKNGIDFGVFEKTYKNGTFIQQLYEYYAF